MVDDTVSRVEQKVARKRFLRRNLHTDFGLLIGAARKGDSELGINLLCKTGTVSARRQGVAAPYIGKAEELLREIEHRLAVRIGAAKLIHDRIHFFGCIQSVAECRIFKRIHLLIGSDEIFLADLFRARLSRLADIQDVTEYKSADLAGLYEDPVFSVVFKHVADAVFIQFTDNPVVQGAAFTDIDRHARTRHRVDFTDLFETDIKRKSLLCFRYKIGTGVIISVGKCVPVASRHDTGRLFFRFLTRSRFHGIGSLDSLGVLGGIDDLVRRFGGTARADQRLADSGILFFVHGSNSFLRFYGRIVQIVRFLCLFGSFCRSSVFSGPRFGQTRSARVCCFTRGAFGTSL